MYVLASRDLILVKPTCRHCYALAVDGHCDPLQPGQDQTSQRLSHFSSSDTSNPLFALYIQSAEKLHWEKYALWKADADQILIFVSP